ncbi:MAG: glutathione S-transferase [Cyanobacteria bacterium J06607_13]
MQLIGMLDSPYVRRVAIALHHFGLPFEHLPLSVFRNVEDFKQINPLVKAPTLVCDDGEVLMDSSLILNYIDRLATAKADSAHLRLMPEPMADYQKALRLIGLGLNACDKTVQIIYERDLRPTEKQHQPWRDRIESQLLSAYGLLEPYAAETSSWLIQNRLTQADITVAVAWQFTQLMVADVVNINSYPGLAALSKRAEALPTFAAAPLARNWQPAET